MFLNLFKQKFLAGWILILAMFIALNGQDQLKWNKIETFNLKSGKSGESFQCFAVPPDSYGSVNKEKRYPVFYMLYNRKSVLKYTVQVISYLASTKLIPPMIVVAVKPNDGRRDLTPTPSRAYGPTSGGAADFLAFVKKDLIPEIDRRYRTQSLRLYGSHSIGGTLGLYTLLTEPDLFSAVLISSPWMTYDLDKRYLIKNAPDYLKKRSNKKNFLSIIVGNELRLKGEIETFVSILKEQAPENLKWKYRFLPKENHQSIKDINLIHGLRDAASWLKAYNAHLVN